MPHSFSSLKIFTFTTSSGYSEHILDVPLVNVLTGVYCEIISKQKKVIAFVICKQSCCLSVHNKFAEFCFEEP